MAAEPSEAPKPLAEIEQGPSKFEQFLDANQRKLIALAVIVIIGVLGFVAYRTIREDNQHAAGAALVGADDLTALLNVAKNHANTPAAASSQLLAADAQWADGRQDDAIATLREFVDQNSSHPARPTALASLGSRLMAQGKNDDAREILNTLLEDPDAGFLAPYALISLGDIARAEGKIDEAEAFLSRARDDYPDDNFSSIATRHLALLRSAAPVEIDPPPPPPMPGPSTDTAPEPDVSKPIVLDPTKMPAPGGNNPLAPAGGTEPTPEPGFNPTPPPTPPTKPATAPGTGEGAAPEAPAKPAKPAKPAGDEGAAPKPAPKKPVATDAVEATAEKAAEPAKESGAATEAAPPKKPESGGNE